MSKTKTTKRFISSKELLKKLTEGEYKEIIEFASNRENDLDVQIRDNYLNIYYRGGNLLRIHPRSFYFDEFYFHTNISYERETRKTYIIEEAKKGNVGCKELIKEYKQKRDEKLDILKKKGMSEYCEEMRVIMDKWEKALNKIGISHDEKNAQQKISMNNRGDTPYTVIDVEYAVSRNSIFHYNNVETDKKVPRFDLIVVDATGQLYVVELKTGLGSINGKSGIEDHIDSFIHTIGRDENGEFREFLKEMSKMLEQKKELKLIGENVIIDEDKKPQFILAFSNKKGENNKYNEFVKKCRGEDIGYDGKIIYLDDSYCLKDR